MDKQADDNGTVDNEGLNRAETPQMSEEVTVARAGSLGENFIYPSDDGSSIESSRTNAVGTEVRSQCLHKWSKH